MKPELIHLPYSPWSEQARWALQVRGIDYRSRVYRPIVGEPELRIRLRRPFAPVTVPVLFTAEGPHADSFAIARYAAAHGSGPELMPPNAGAAIEHWHALSERGLAAGRARSLQRVLKDHEALAEMVPKGLRALLGPTVPVIAATGVRRTIYKYGAHRGDHLSELDAVLAALRLALPREPWSADDPPTLLPAHGLTYADICMAQVLAFIAPPDRGLRLGRASRSSFTDPELIDQCRDLIAWRDALYARYREPSRTDV